jgi:SAM-dependent methyltransferase
MISAGSHDASVRLKPFAGRISDTSRASYHGGRSSHRLGRLAESPMLLGRFVELLTSGGSQNFLGYRWMGGLLSAMPSDWRREMALRCLSLSPHYFYRTPANKALNGRDFRESEASRNSACREVIINDLVRRHLSSGQTILDFGCGPGFLAHAASRFVGKVFACDISPGVLACARILNGAPNIEYIEARQDGGIPLPNASVDLIYSFAVIQHITDDVFQSVLREWRRVLRPGGIVVCHIVVNRADWRSERQWQEDRSLRGRLRWQFGLHCFTRLSEQVNAMVTAAGFGSPKIVLIRDLDVHFEDDVAGQHLCTFGK